MLFTNVATDKNKQQPKKQNVAKGFYHVFIPKHGTIENKHDHRQMLFLQMNFCLV